jgi:hypothetical protein
VRLFAQGVMTHLGILHEAGHPEPWIIAMDCAPTWARVLDYAARWAIEICQTQPIKIPHGSFGHRLRLRAKPGGCLKREQVIGVDLSAGHDHLVDQAADHRLTIFERQLIQTFA